MLLTHAKPNIKAKALEVFLLMFEVTEVFNDSIDTMKTLLAHKNVKVSFFMDNYFQRRLSERLACFVQNDHQ